MTAKNQSNNNFVAMGMSVCPICGQEHSTSILIHKRLKNIDDQVTGYQMCPEHQALFDKGYVALVEVDPSKSKPEQGVMYRTGNVMHVKAPLAKDLFPDFVKDGQPIMHVEIGVLEQIAEIYKQSTGEDSVPNANDLPGDSHE